MKKSLILATVALVGCSYLQGSPVNVNQMVFIYDASNTYALTIKAFDKNGHSTGPSRKISSKGKVFRGKIKDFMTQSKNKSAVYQLYLGSPSDHYYVIDSKPARVCLKYHDPRDYGQEDKWVGQWVYYKLKNTKTPIDSLTYKEDVDYKQNGTSTMHVDLMSQAKSNTSPAFFVVDVGASTKNNITIKLMTSDELDKKTKGKVGLNHAHIPAGMSHQDLLKEEMHED